VSLGAVAERALVVPEAAAALIGTKVDDAALKALAAAASAACRPIDDKRGTKEYRTKVAGVLARRAAEIALNRARGRTDGQASCDDDGQRRPRRVPVRDAADRCSTCCATI
jgi:xanthine dehydrogenase iron-sulfur cluster and FAD-binding subunit A